MIRQLTEADRRSVLDYLYRDANFNIFPIGDIEKFGFDKDFQKLWAEFDANGEYLSIFLRYRDNGVYYSHQNRFNEEYLDILKNQDINVINGKAELMDLLKPHLPDFDQKRTYFCQAKHMAVPYLEESDQIKVILTKEDCERLYYFLADIEEFNITRRSVDDFVESKIKSISMGMTLYIEDNGKIVASVATTAETSKSAMVVAVGTDKAYRKRGYASKLMLALMDHYINDKKKELCLFYDNPEAGKIYLRLGFEYVGLWDMYIRKHISET